MNAGFADFLRRELSCEATECDWRWVEEPGYKRSVRCNSCGSGFPWRDTYYLARIYKAETNQ